MIVRQLEDLAAAGRVVEAPTWTSRRLLLRGDGMGFSLHDTLIHAGTHTVMHYKHHLEAVYCIEGEGVLEDLDSARQYPLQPGTVYALDANDRHAVRAQTQLRLVCVFNPALVGPENHGPDGAYPLL